MKIETKNPNIKKYILTKTEKRLTYVEEYKDKNKYILHDTIEGYQHSGIGESKITFEGNLCFNDLIDHLEKAMAYKEETLNILYEDE